MLIASGPGVPALANRAPVYCEYSVLTKTRSKSSTLAISLIFVSRQRPPA